VPPRRRTLSGMTVTITGPDASAVPLPPKSPLTMITAAPIRANVEPRVDRVNRRIR